MIKDEWQYGVMRSLLEDAREDEALEVFLATARDLPAHPDVYREFYRPLAELAIRRGALDVAEAILGKIPSSQRGDLPELLLGVQEARENKLVFPPWIPVGERWDGPRLFAKDEVSDWMPGRVARIEGDKVTFQVATRGDRGEVRFGWFYTPLEGGGQQPSAGEILTPGTFVEIATRRGSDRREILVFRR